MPLTSLNVLLTDDNVNEHFFFKHCAKNISDKIKIISLNSGKALIDFLENAENALPDILFLDVNMPLKNGNECLADIRAKDRYDKLQVVMYSTSDSNEDVERAFELGANLYVKKPVGIDELKQVLVRVFAIFEENKLQSIEKNDFLVDIIS
jgi:DNA-binding response OmpR family regulator